MQVTESTIPDQHRLTFSGKRLDDERMISDYNVIHGIHVVRERDSGGDDARFLHDVRTVSLQTESEQVTTAVLRQNIFRGGDSGIIGTIRRGQLKEVSPRKNTPTCKCLATSRRKT